MHRIANRRARDTEAFLFGRRMFEMMENFWTSPERAVGGDVEAEFARIYVETPRIVFSDLIDQIDPYVVPTVLGGGTPFYPPGHRLDLMLAEHRFFAASGWTYQRYIVTR